MKRILPFFCLFACAGLFAATPTATISFNVTSGAWGDAANWNGGVLPGSTSAAIISGGKTATIADGQTYLLGYLSVGASTLSISNGTLSLQAGYTQSIIGTASGSATLYVGPSGTFMTGTNSLVGYTAGSNALLEISGGTYSMASGYWTYVGTGTKTLASAAATGSVYIHNAATVNLGTGMSIGRDAGNVGYLTLSGGSMTGAAFTMGDNYVVSTGLYAKGYGVITSGSIAVTGSVSVGGQGEGHLTLSRVAGDTTSTIVLSTSNDIVVGGGAGEASTFYASDGTIRARNITAGAYRTSTLNGMGMVTLSGVHDVSLSGAMIVGTVNYSSVANNVSSAAIANSDVTMLYMLVGSTGGKYSGTINNRVIEGVSAGVATISSSNITFAGTTIVGQSGTGSMLVENSNITLNAGGQLVAGMQAYNTTLTNGDVILFGAGNGTLTLNNTVITGVSNNNRIYAGIGGVGTIAANNVTVSGLTTFGVGMLQQRNMTYSSPTYDALIVTVGGTILNSAVRGTGSFTMNGGSILVGTGSDTPEISVGQGGTGALVVLAGSMTTGGALYAGREIAATLSISNGAGTLTTVSQGYKGDATVDIRGGTVNVTNFYLATGLATADQHDDNTKRAVAVATISGGTVNVLSSSTSWGNILVGNNSSYSSASLTVYNGADVNASGTFYVYNYGSLTFGLRGGNAAFNTQPIISANALGLSVSGGYHIDFDGYAATEDKTITLISYNTKPSNADSIVFDTVNLDSAKYAIGNITWGANALTVTVNYIPEPATCAALLGLLALALAVRRRR